MNIKNLTMALILSATLLGSASYAAAATPDSTETVNEESGRKESYRKNGRQGKRHDSKRSDKSEERQQHRSEMLTFFKDFEKAEKDLFVSIDGMDKAEAEKKIDEFYNTELNKAPTRTPRMIETVTETIEGMDIPEETKKKVIEKINNTPNKRIESLKNRSILFAKSLLEMTPEEREDAIREHDAVMDYRFSHMGGKGRGMRGGKHGRHSGRGMMMGNKGMCRDGNAENCRGEGRGEHDGRGMHNGRGERDGRGMHNNRDERDGRGRGYGRGEGDCASEGCTNPDCPLYKPEDNPPAPAE